MAAGLPVLQPDRLKDPSFIETFTAFEPDVGVVAAYGKILPDQVLAIPRLGMVNVHASLLPKYRGAAPVHRAVMAGDTETGVTIMRVVKALDAGPMLATVRYPIGAEETSEQVERALAEQGAPLLVETLDRLAAGTAEEVPQTDADATYASRITREDGVIAWTRSAQAIHDQIRGLYPWPHAFSFVGGGRIIVWTSTVVPPGPERTRTAAGPGAPVHDGAAAPGTIVAAGHDRLQVATGDGVLALTMLQAEGRRPLPVREFLAGHPLEVGTRFAPGP
jgi:methionyl-tRNA formyltransferase